MTNSNVVILDREFDPWIHQPKNNQPVPETAELVCIIKLNVGPEILDELIWFNRTQDKDELWSLNTLDDSIHWPNVPDASLLKRGRVSASARAGTPAKSAYRLLQDYIQWRTGHAWPCGFIKPGLLDEQAFEKLLEGIERGFDNSKKVARKLVPPLIGWPATFARPDNSLAGPLSGHQAWPFYQPEGV